MKAEEARALVQKAITSAENGEQTVQGQLRSGASAIAVILARAKDEIERVGRQQFELVQQIKNAKINADIAMAGEDGDAVRNTMDFLISSETDAEDNVAKLRVMIESLDRSAREILITYTEDNERVAGKLHSARNYMSQYYNSL